MPSDQETLAYMGKLILDIHDALHAECDGKANLPDEIRALRADLAAARAEAGRLRDVKDGAWRAANSRYRRLLLRWERADAAWKAALRVIA